MSTTRYLLSALFVAAGAACGGSTSGNGTSNGVQGTVNGTPVSVTDSMAITGPQTVAGVTAQLVGAFLTNVNGVCGVLQRKGNPPNVDMIALSVSTAGASIPPGKYPIGYSNGFAGEVAYTADNSMCKTTTNETATTGSITITQVTSTIVEGSFDATFMNGDHLSGNFSAPLCPLTLQQIVDDRSPCGS
jgi:hypothetical protein